MMTQQDRDAIEGAIIKGIETAIDAVLVNPFPRRTDGAVDYHSALFHARGKIQAAIQRELSRIATAPPGKA